MNEKKKSLWKLLNPLEWINAAFAMLAWVMGPILRFLGLMPPPNTEGFQNIQKSDVDEAAEQAKRTEEAVDAILKDMSPAEVVKAFANASPEARAEIDLGALDAEGVDWLLGLSEDDLTLLAMSTTAGCARSLEARAMKPAYSKPRPETEAPAVLSTTSADEEDYEEWKRQLVAKHFRELFHAPGVPNLEPKHTPGPTVH